MQREQPRAERVILPHRVGPAAPRAAPLSKVPDRVAVHAQSHVDKDERCAIVPPEEQVRAVRRPRARLDERHAPMHATAQ
eukprot:978862-Prymnesium_polylepis.1